VSPNNLYVYLKDILDAAQVACQFVKGMSKADFFEDRRTQQAVAMSIVIISEAAQKIHKKHPSFASQHTEIPWDDIRGMCNRIVHTYFAITWQYVWDTLHGDLPQLIAAIEPCLKAEQVTDEDDSGPTP